MKIISLFFSMMTLGILLGVSPILAAEEPATQTSTETAAVNAQVEALATEVEAVEAPFEGIEIEKPDKAPSRFGSFWRNIKENVSLAVTFDPNKKAEKAMKFAEERMLIAEKVLADGTDENAKVQAEKHFARAQKMMQKMDEQQKKALEKPTEDTERLLKNRAKQFEHQQEIFDRLEEKSNDVILETVLKFREETAEHGKGLEQALENTNIPEDVREHLKEVKMRMDEHANEMKVHVAKFQELKAAAEGGDENAVKKLEAFKDERKQEARKNNEEQQEKKGNFEAKMNKIREAVENGDEQAQMMFEKMQDRPEFKERMEEMQARSERDQKGNEQNREPREQRDQSFDPNNRPGNQEARPEGSEMNREERTNAEQQNQPPPGFFSKMKGFFKKDGEQGQPPEGFEQGEPPKSGEEPQDQGGKQKPEGFFKGIRNFINRDHQENQQNPSRVEGESGTFEKTPQGDEQKAPRADQKGEGRQGVPFGNKTMPPKGIMQDAPEKFDGGPNGQPPQNFQPKQNNVGENGGAFKGGNPGPDGFKGFKGGEPQGGGPQGGNPGGNPQGSFSPPPKGEAAGGGSFGGSAPQNTAPSAGGPQPSGNFGGGAPAGGSGPSGGGAPSGGPAGQ